MPTTFFGSKPVTFCMMPTMASSGLVMTMTNACGKNGVEKIINIKLSADEQKMFDHSVNAVKDLVSAAEKIAA